MTVLVTGGTGYLGGALVEALLEQGERVRVLARPHSKVSELDAKGVEIAMGDLLDAESVLTAVRGCRVVYHAGGMYSVKPGDRRALFQTQVEGTRNVLAAAQQSDVERVVYTSSAITIGENQGETGDEDTVHRGTFHSAYEEGKYLAEQVVLAYARAGLPVIIVNPAMMYGPGDLKPPGMGVVHLLNGVYPGLMSGALSFVYREDTARGHLLAAEKGTPGERYILCDRWFTIQEWYGCAARLAGRPLPPVVPNIVARTYAQAAEAWARLRGREATLAVESYHTAAHGFRVDGKKARQMLGLEHLDHEEGLRIAIRWWWQAGYLRHRPECL